MLLFICNAQKIHFCVVDISFKTLNYALKMRILSLSLSFSLETAVILTNVEQH